MLRYKALSSTRNNTQQDVARKKHLYYDEYNNQQERGSIVDDKSKSETPQKGSTTNIFHWFSSTSKLFKLRWYQKHYIFEICILVLALYLLRAIVIGLNNQCEKRIYPICVFLQSDYYINTNEFRSSNPICVSASYDDKLYPFIFNEHHRSRLRNDVDSFEEGDCKAIGAWQLQYDPTCNMLHEVSQRSNDYQNTKLLSNGSYRDTWMMKWHDSTYAMKTLKSSNELSLRNLDRHRRDAVIMSMLSSSIHIPNIYANCGDSGIFEYSPGGDMMSMIERTKEEERDGMWTDEEMLRYAWQAAAALTDVHKVGYHGFPAIAHTDLDTDQFLWIDGMFKVNSYVHSMIHWYIYIYIYIHIYIYIYIRSLPFFIYQQSNNCTVFLVDS